MNSANVTDHNPPGAPRTLVGEMKTSGPGGSDVTISSTFGEAGINLSDSNIFPSNQCAHFGSAYVKSRSAGQSFTSELKDFIAPVPVNISNCGQVIIRKVTDPAGDTTTDFGYTTDVVTAPATTTSPFSLKDGEANTIDNVLAASGYNVTEDDPSGDLYCSRTSTATPARCLTQTSTSTSLHARSTSTSTPTRRSTARSPTRCRSAR